MADEDGSAKVGALLNEALSGSADKDTKLRQLAEIQEILIHREVELLDAFFDEMLQFGTDKSAEVRKVVVGFIEEACKKKPALFSRATGTLSFLMDDNAVPVIMSSIRANINLYRPTFLQLARNPNSIKGADALWASVEAMRERITELIRADKANVQNIAMSYLECIVVVHSYPTANSTVKKGQYAGLNAVPLRHPILDLDALRSSGRACYDTLAKEMLSTEASGSGVGVIVGLLTSIACQRPDQYMRETIALLINLQKDPPAHIKENRSWTSNERKLKAQLLILFKHISSAPFHEQLVPVLENLDVVASVLNEFDKRGQVDAAGVDASKKHAIGEDAFVPEGKRVKVDADPHKRMAHSLYERLKGLPIDRIVNLIMHSMPKLPGALPEHLASLPTLICDPMSDDEEMADADGAGGAGGAGSASADGGSGGGGSASGGGGGGGAAAIKARPKVPTVRKDRKPFELKPLKLDDARSKSLSLRAFKSLLNSEKHAATWNEWGTVVAKLTAELRDDALTDALVSFVLAAPKERINIATLWLHHEHMRCVAISGKGGSSTGTGTGTDTNPAAMDADDADDADDAAAAATAAAAAATAATAAASAAPGEEAPPPSTDADKAAATARWEGCVEKLLTGLKPYIEEVTKQDRTKGRANQDPLFPSLILALPTLSPGTLVLLQSYCEEKSLAGAGFTALYNVLQSRPPARKVCLPILFKYTSSPTKFVRDVAAKVAASLYEQPSMREAIEEHSTMLVGCLEGEKDAEGKVWIAEAIEGCLDLRLTLASNYPRLLRKITEVYAKMQYTQAASVKKYMRKEKWVPGVAKGMQITQDNADVVDLVGDFLPGCVVLVVQLLHTVVGKVLPSPGVVAAVEKSYAAGRNDARLLVPILQGLGKQRVLAVLPHVFALADDEDDEGSGAQHIARSIDLLLGHANVSANPTFDAAELLVLLLRIPSPRKGDALTTKKLLKVWSICFSKKIFNQDVLTIVLQRTADDATLPLLYFKTALQALKQYPRLKDKFFVNLLRKLATKDSVWKAKTQVIKGFIMLCEMMLPQSLDIVKRLSEDQQRTVYATAPNLKLMIIKQLKLMKEEDQDQQPKNLRLALGDDFPNATDAKK